MPVYTRAAAKHAAKKQILFQIQDNEEYLDGIFQETVFSNMLDKHEAEEEEWRNWEEYQERRNPRWDEEWGCPCADCRKVVDQAESDLYIAESELYMAEDDLFYGPRDVAPQGIF